MALSQEAPVPSEPGKEQWPYSSKLILPFDGDVLVINETEFILASSASFNGVISDRSMFLLIAAPLKTKFYFPSGLSKGFQKDENLDSDSINVLPSRISHNPKRNSIRMDEDYEIRFHGATGGRFSLEGDLIITLGSKKAVKKELIPRPSDLAEELRIRRERAKTSPIVLP